MSTAPNYVIPTLTYGFSWEKDSRTYSFPTNNSSWQDSNPNRLLDFSFNSIQAEQFRKVVKLWGDLIDLNFIEVSEPSHQGDIRIAFFKGDFSEATFGTGIIRIGDYLTSSDFIEGNYSFNTLLHEFGHILGLSHPFSQSNDKNLQVYFSDDKDRLHFFPKPEENYLYTVLSYTGISKNIGFNFSYQENSNNNVYNYYEPETPMLYDIAAVQSIYGANYQTRSGDTLYRFTERSIEKPFYQSLWDGGGIDTIDVSEQVDPNLINLQDGSFSSIGIVSLSELKTIIHTAFPNYTYWLDNTFFPDKQERLYTGENNLSIAYGAIIENAIGGSNDDTLIGNEYRNQLTGNAGNDLLDGKAGYDYALYDEVYQNVVLDDNNATIQISLNSDQDTLVNIEEVIFSNAHYYHSDIANSIYRLYQAAFDRLPDIPGLSYWLLEQDKGVELRDIANSFIFSTEFTSQYGDTHNTDVFITNLYQNVLHRAPEEIGFNHWKNNIEQGYTTLQDMLVLFSESGENIQSFTDNVGDGFWLYV